MWDDVEDDGSHVGLALVVKQLVQAVELHKKLKKGRITTNAQNCIIGSLKGLVTFLEHTYVS